MSQRLVFFLIAFQATQFGYMTENLNTMFSMPGLQVCVFLDIDQGYLYIPDLYLHQKAHQWSQVISMYAEFFFIILE